MWKLSSTQIWVLFTFSTASEMMRTILKAAGIFCTFRRDWQASNTETLLAKFPSDEVMVTCSPTHCCWLSSCPHACAWLHKSGRLFMVSWTYSSQCSEVQSADRRFIFLPSRLLPLSAGWSLLFMSIKADLLHYFSNWMSDADVISHITPDIILPLSLCSSPCLLLCVTSPQGEASQYPPTGGCLWDQKGVLPLPWTVSSDVWWVGGGGLSACLRSRSCWWTQRVDYRLVGNELSEQELL